MVRETRHLWVGNLPDNIREDRIREHFKRYGRVQSVKVVAKGGEAGSGGGGAGVGPTTCAAVAFMDIRSAAKAHNAEHTLDERTLTTDYYEPAAIPSSSAGSSPAGSGYSAASSSASVSSRQAPPATEPNTAAVPTDPRLAPSDDSGTGTTSTAWRTLELVEAGAANYTRRATTPAYVPRERVYRNGPTTTAPQYSSSPSSVPDRSTHPRWYTCTDGNASSEASGSARRRRRVRRVRSGSAASTGTAGTGTAGAISNSSRSSSSEPRSPPSSASSRTSSPAAGTGSSANTPRQRSTHQWTPGGIRALAICVRNLPARSSDSSLKDGLYHEYKKHGKVAWVKVVGQNQDRYAVVRFKKPSDVEKALEVSQDKLFFGCKISVAPYQGCDADDSEAARPYETDLDEYHPKATRTLFIGNLEKDVTPATLREKFKHFGRIIEIDVKKQSGGSAGYAFCQYASISSVVEAIRAMDGEYVGGSRVKLGFGKSMATTCVWMDGLTEQTEKQVAALVGRYGTVASLAVDRSAGAALAHYEQAGAAAAAVRDLRQPGRLMVDFASRECQEAFYEQLEKHAGPGFDATQARYIRYEGLRYEGGTRYVPRSSVARRYAPEHYEALGLEYAPERRYRSYEELGASNSPSEETLPVGANGAGAAGIAGGYEGRASTHRQRSLDSSPDERHTPAPSTPTSTNNKRYKDQHWSGSGRRSSGEGRNRSRSGSHSDRRRRISDAERRRHRRRRDDSPASRAGTPLCDEMPDGPAPAEPRKPPLPPRDRNHPPMSLPLPKFAAQVLRTVSVNASPEKLIVAEEAAVAEPSSPPRAPASSATSSSSGSAPHSPSLEERIRSLDEKYEKWSGTRVTPAEAAERGRFRHRLLDLDIKEVRPSEVVRSLLAKRSVFDEDLERLEGSSGVDRRAGSPCSVGSPRSRDPRPAAPRTLQYPFPSHPPPPLPVGPPPEDASLLLPLPLPINVPCNLANVPLPPLPPLPLEAPPTPPTPPTPCTDERVPPIDGPASDAFPPRNNCIKIESKINKDPRCVPKKDLENKSDMELCAKDSDKHRQPVIVTANSDNLDRRKSDIGDGKSHRTDADDLQLELRDNIKQIDKIVNLDKNISDKKLSDVDKLTKNEKTVNSVSQIDRKHDSVRSHVKHNSDKSHTEITEKRRSDKQEKERTDHEREVKKSKEHSRTEADKDKEQRDKLEKERREKAEKERAEKLAHQASLDKLEWERLEFERAEAEKADKAEKEKNDKEKVDRERIERERTEKEKEKERLQREKSEREKQQREKVEKERLQRERADKERLHREQREKERALREAEDKERAEKELIEQERADKERTEKDHELRLQAEREQACQTQNCDKEQVSEVKQNTSKHDSRKERTDKDKRKEENYETNEHACKDKRKETSDKPENSKHSKHRKDHGENRKESKRDVENKCKSVSRKSSRDETARDFFRKDSSDSTASRASHDSTKSKEHDQTDLKEEKQSYNRAKHSHYRHKQDKEQSPKNIGKNTEPLKTDLDRPNTEKTEKTRILESKNDTEQEQKDKKMSSENQLDKQRHNSLDCPASSISVDAKRKERLNSSSSLPSNIGSKRRISSQENLDSLIDDSKRIKLCDIKLPERRDSKEYKSNERLKYNKYKLNHTKSLEEKIKDDKKQLTKFIDREKYFENKSEDKETKPHFPCNENKSLKNSPKASSAEEKEASLVPQLNKEESEQKIDSRPANIEFLATLELRSSEEDEKLKALKKEMKEKKRIQQLQQIQELQMQQDAMQQADAFNKNKDDKKYKCDDRKKEHDEKRMSTERKSREEKNEIRKKCRKPTNSSDTSDSDEPKKHSIFDIEDEGPTYISMYDKVKARSCKNMQKQEEEKRQEKIKAKFSQLKQSRAKREEKKRSTSWDGDSDSDIDHKHRNSLHQLCNTTSSEDDQHRHSHTDSENEHSKDRLTDCHDTNIDADPQCKLSRKNSRTRIMSDSSEDEAVKRKLHNMKTEADIKSELDTHIKSEMFSVLDIPQSLSKNMQQNLDYLFKTTKLPKIENVVKKEYDEKFSNNALKSLFNDKLHTHDDIGENIRTNSEHDNKLDHLKPCSLKTVVNDHSSEGECALFNSNLNQCDSEIRKKHKKKQRKQKCVVIEEEDKFVENYDTSADNDLRLKHIERNRKHANKKEKKRDKIRDSVDAEDCKEVKVKKNKKPGLFDMKSDSTAKRDDKMKDIFGALSEDSDPSPKTLPNINKNIYSQANVSSDLDSYQSFGGKLNEISTKEKYREETRKHKEKKRKERKTIVREDDNSLDVDAAGKAIEDSLFADSLNENDHQNVKYKPGINNAKFESEIFHFTDGNNKIESSVIANELNILEKSRKDSKERKKKKKRNREDRQSRREHHHHHSKANKLAPIPLPDKEISSMTSELPLPDNVQSTSEIKSALSSPSLPRLTESPPLFKIHDENISEINKTPSDTKPKSPAKIHQDLEQNINITDITNTATKSLSFNSTLSPKHVEARRLSEKFITVFGAEIDDSVSQNAVKSISAFGSPTIERNESIVDNALVESDTESCKLDDKMEKPRAIISQEETEDAVAALLGESFGGNSNSFPDCYDDADQVPENQAPAPSPSNNLPEEDAEEMRQAVQNLNASELEIKPDTPLSENDLQIDTDTDDAEETLQESPVKQLPNVSVSLSLSSSNTFPETKRTFSSLMQPTFSAISTKPAFTAMHTTSSTTPIFREKNAAVSEKMTVLIPSTQALITTARTIEPAFKPEQYTTTPSMDFRIPVNVNNLQHVTSTATPVISTTWALTGNKPREQIFCTATLPISRDEKIIPVNPSMLQIKTSTSTVNTLVRPVISTLRHNAPYQVINHMLRPPQLTNLQPPTIKIPDQHLVYQKPPSVMISPRMTNDIRLHSPKSNPTQGALSPRLPGAPVLGMTSPPGLQHRSPGQVTVVRQVLQPPLSPIQRACSVLVQNHVNRLPVTPVLAPLSKSMHNNIVNHQNKNVNAHNIIHPPKLMPVMDLRKNDQRVIHDPIVTNKLILSSSNLQQSQNPTVMAQNRLISMQNAHAAGFNKLVYNSAADKRDVAGICFKAEPPKSEPHNHLPFSQPPPVLHISSVNQNSLPGQHAGVKPTGTIAQEQFSPNRQAPHVSNVIPSMSHQRIINTAPSTCVIPTDAARSPSNIFSIASHRLPPVVSKVDASTNVSLTSSVLSKVVMTPLLIKASGQTNIKLNSSTEPLKVSGLISTVVSSSMGNFNKDEKLECFIVKPVIQDMPVVNETNLKTLSLFEKNLPQDDKSKAAIEKSTTEKSSSLFEKCTPSIGKTSPQAEKPLPQIEELPPQNEIPTLQIKKHSPIDQPEPEKVSVKETPSNLAREFETKDQTDFEELLKDTTNEIKITMGPDRKVEISTPPANTSVPKPTLDIKVPEANIIHEKENIVKEIVQTTPVTSSLSPKPISEIFSSLDSGSKEDGDWSAKEVNIDSVIKKVEALCDNEISMDSDKEEKTKINEPSLETMVTEQKAFMENTPLQVTKPISDSVHENNVGIEKMDACKSPSLQNIDLIETFDPDIKPVKRGGGRIRGRKTGVSVRPISKPSRGSAPTRRGRGKAKTDRKTKITLTGPNLPGDIYDFHEDSGDDTDTSPQSKSEARPRLILTISKGPHSSPTNSITNTPVSSVGISKEGTNDKVAPGLILREEKIDEFISPALNTRKSRRLQEKDGRSTVDDVIDDVVKNSTVQLKGVISGKDATRRTTRQNGAKPGALEKSISDLRKSPRGTKRTKDRRASETSLDSSDEKTMVKNDILDLPTDRKVPKLTENVENTISPSVTAGAASSGLAAPIVAAVSTTMLSTTPTPLVSVTSAPVVSSTLAPTNVDTPIPFMKPPKKMLSEINAKMAMGTFDKTPPLIVNSSVSVINTANMEVDSSATPQEQQTKNIVQKPMELSLSNKIDKGLESNTVVRNCLEGLKESTEELIIDPVTGELICMKRTTDGGLQPVQVLPPGSVPSIVSKPASVSLASLSAVSSPLTARSTPEIEPTPLKLDYSVKTLNRHFNALQGGNYQVPVSSVAVSTIQSPRVHYTLNVPSSINSLERKQEPSIIQARLTGVNPGMQIKNLAMPSPSSSPNILTITSIANPIGVSNMLPGLPNIVSGVSVLSAGLPNVISGVPNMGLGVPHMVSGVPNKSPRMPSLGQGVPSISTGVPNVSPGVPNMGPGVPSLGSGTANMGNVRPCVANVPNVAGGVAHVPSGVAGVAARVGVRLPGRAALAVPGASLPRGAHAPSPPLAKHVAVMGPQAPIAGANNSRVSLTSVPMGSPQSQVPMGDGLYGAHFAHQHYQAYQQHFRAAHESRATPSPYVARSPLGAEGSEAPSPPLELRRLPCARVVRPSHSPCATAGRDVPAAHSPCVPGLRDPPPAHSTRLPQSIGPAHASQVPREADSLQMLLRRYPVMWQGLLALKNDAAAVQMHFVHGNPTVANATLPRHVDGSTPPLRIAQRMRLEPVQLEAVHRKMQLEMEHCMLLALPCGRDHMDVLQQSTNLTSGFITYLQRKQAAGIVNVAPPGHQQAMYTVHIFPSCEFANDNLARIAPDLLHRVADIAHLLIVIATV